jgi:hypothetical protein
MYNANGSFLKTVTNSVLRFDGRVVYRSRNHTFSKRKPRNQRCRCRTTLSLFGHLEKWLPTADGRSESAFSYIELLGEYIGEGTALRGKETYRHYICCDSDVRTRYIVNPRTNLETTGYTDATRLQEAKNMRERSKIN